MEWGCGGWGRGVLWVESGFGVWERVVGVVDGRVGVVDRGVVVVDRGVVWWIEVNRGVEMV